MHLILGTFAVILRGQKWRMEYEWNPGALGRGGDERMDV